MYSIDEELITVSLDGGEAMYVMKAIALRLMQIPLKNRTEEEQEEIEFLHNFTDKIGPLISEKAAQSRMCRDQLN